MQFASFFLAAKVGGWAAYACHARDYPTHHHRRPDRSKNGTDTPLYSRIMGLTSVKTDLRLPSQ
jgi:hypothetical protein